GAWRLFRLDAAARAQPPVSGRSRYLGSVAVQEFPGIKSGNGIPNKSGMAASAHHHVETPSAWVCRWAERIAPGGRVLDVACGNGRHARWLAARGHPVEAVDRDAALLAKLAAIPGIATRCADLEAGAWPYAGQAFAAIV